MQEQVRTRRKSKGHKEAVKRFVTKLHMCPSVSTEEVQVAQIGTIPTGMQVVRMRTDVSREEVQVAQIGLSPTEVQDVPQQSVPQDTPSSEQTTIMDNEISTFPYEHIVMFQNFFETVGQDRLPGIWNPDDPTGVNRDPEEVDRFTQEHLRQWF